MTLNMAISPKVQELNNARNGKWMLNMGENIFLSYCWDDFDDVNRIDNMFERYGVTLHRDIRDLGYEDNIYHFMNKINEHHQIIVYLSDSYLKSTNCMYEASQLLKQKDKVIIIIKSGTEVFGIEDKARFIEYWKEKYIAISHKDPVEFRKEIDSIKIAYDTISVFIDFIKEHKRRFDNDIDFSSLLARSNIEFSEIITKDVIDWINKYENTSVFDVIHLISDLYKSKLIKSSEFSNIPDNELEYYFKAISFSRNINGIDLSIAVQTIDTGEYTNITFSRLVQIKENTIRSEGHSKFYFYCENPLKKQRCMELERRSSFAVLNKEEKDIKETGYCDVFRIIINF